MCKCRQQSYKRQELLTLWALGFTPGFLVRSILLIILVFCVVLCCVSFSFGFFSSNFRRKKVKLLSSLWRLGRLSFRLSFLSESISQKLSKVSICNLEYLFTIKRGTNYNKADDPVICISRVICPCFNIVHRN